MFHSLRLAPLALLAAALVTLAPPLSAGGKKSDSKDFVDLFNGKDLTGFKTILSGGKEDQGKVFTVKDGVINVSGNPNGYFYTDKSYKNYVLRFDWKYLKDGNSGLLVHITGKHTVWPKCIEVQGEQKTHGNIFAIGGAKGTFKTDKDAQKEAIKTGEWNTTEVTVKNGMITSSINGKQISTGKITSDDVTEGPFGFQSEGVPLQFKNIKIKVLE